MNTGVLYGLHTLAAIPLIPASIIAIETSVLSNYYLNSAWTFADPDITLQKVCKFHAVSAVPICANIVILYFFANSGMYYLYANLLGIAAGLTWNYLVNARWTWPDPR